MGKYRKFILISIILFTHMSCLQSRQKISLNEEPLKTMKVLVDALLKMQLLNENDPDYGTINCSCCKALHTRAAEDVYPFAVAYKNLTDNKYLKTAINVGNWLIPQQAAEDDWKETPKEWTGTTADQLLMMILAFDILKDELTDDNRRLWMSSMKKAADYTTKYIDTNFASINYCRTTMATLAMMNHYFPNDAREQKAKDLAFEVASKMDEDAFICAEEDRVNGTKYRADIGYEIDMSLWGMALYARVMKDAFINELVKHSLENYLYFVYLDCSWGFRSNKWTT